MSSAMWSSPGPSPPPTGASVNAAQARPARGPARLSMRPNARASTFLKHDEVFSRPLSSSASAAVSVSRVAVAVPLLPTGPGWGSPASARPKGSDHLATSTHVSPSSAKPHPPQSPPAPFPSDDEIRLAEGGAIPQSTHGLKGLSSNGCSRESVSAQARGSPDGGRTHGGLRALHRPRGKKQVRPDEPVCTLLNTGVPAAAPPPEFGPCGPCCFWTEDRTLQRARLLNLDPNSAVEGHALS